MGGGEVLVREYCDGREGEVEVREFCDGRGSSGGKGVW